MKLPTWEIGGDEYRLVAFGNVIIRENSFHSSEWHSDGRMDPGSALAIFERRTRIALEERGVAVNLRYLGEDYIWHNVVGTAHGLANSHHEAQLAALEAIAKEDS